MANYIKYLELQLYLLLRKQKLIKMSNEKLWTRDLNKEEQSKWYRREMLIFVFILPSRLWTIVKHVLYYDDWIPTRFAWISYCKCHIHTFRRHLVQCWLPNSENGKVNNIFSSQNPIKEETNHPSMMSS